MRSPLLTAATSTFESLALLLPEPTLTERQADAALMYAVRIVFEGPFGGTLVLRVSEDVATALAENMLGAEHVDARARRDAVGEVANVICGNVLPMIGGREAVFHLGAPEPLAGDDAGPARADHLPTADIALGIDDGRATVALFCDGAEGLSPAAHASAEPASATTPPALVP